MVARFEAQLAEIQSVLTSQSTDSKEDFKRHPEAKSFDELTLDEKIGLVAFHARMNQARDLDLISS